MIRPNTLGVLWGAGFGIMSLATLYDSKSPQEDYIGIGAGLTALILTGATLRDPSTDEQAQLEARSREQYLLSRH